MTLFEETAQLDSLHAFVQAHKITPHAQRTPDSSARTLRASKQLGELLEQITEQALELALAALEGGDMVTTHEQVARLTDLRKYRRFKTLWDLDHEH